MKRCLWAIILAMLLTITLIPTQDAHAAGEKALMLRYMSYNNGWYENTEASLRNFLDITIDHTTALKFYFFDGENEYPVTLDELIVPNCIELVEVSDADFLLVYGVACGEGFIYYERDGVTYSLAVSVPLPDFGFYSTPAASAESYLSEFPLTDQCNSLYFAAIDDSFGLTDVTVTGAYADLAVAEKVSDTCWKITVNGVSDDEDDWLEILYSGTNEWGSFTGYFDAICILDAMPGLRCRFLWWNGEGYEVDLTEPLDNILETQIDDNWYMQFYFFDGENEYPLTPDDLTTSGDITLTMDEYYNVPLLTASGFGDSAVHYERDGVTYSMPVYISLPTFWFYSTPTPSVESYLPKLRVTELGQTFYFVSDGSVALSDLAPINGFDNFAYAEQISDYCWKIVITDYLYDNYYCYIGFTGTYEYGDSYYYTRNILITAAMSGDVNDDGIVNGTDTNLIFRYVSGTLGFDDAQLAAADVNCDGLVNGTDTNLVFRFVSGTLGSFE